MARTTQRLHGRPVRPGVTLIELLVVIAIIGVLLALTTAALQKTVEGQNVRSSESQVFKLQQALDMEYDRVVQKCDADSRNNGIPPELVSYCEGNMARAKAVWTAYQLRLHFPDTFAEASVVVPLRDSANNVIYVAKPLATFNSVRALGTAGPFAPNEESGALLYIILTQKSVGAAAMGAAGDDLSQAMRKKVTFNGVELDTFADAFKNSVGFNRWKQDTVGGPVELEAAPYLDQRALASNPRNTDPIDPQNLVAGWSDRFKRNLMDQPAPVSLLFNARNRVANVYSHGRTHRAASPTPLDDILGYRLRKQGEKGYKP